MRQLPATNNKVKKYHKSGSNLRQTHKKLNTNYTNLVDMLFMTSSQEIEPAQGKQQAYKFMIQQVSKYICNMH